MTVKLFRSAAGVLAASMVIDEHWSPMSTIDVVDRSAPSVPREFSSRSKSQSKAQPDKKAARKRQKKARAITRRNQP